MTRKKVMVVDDSKTINDMVRNLLEKMGYEVEVAFDGMEALEKVKTLLPDLIVLDVNMPKMDGFRVCRLLKFDRNFRQIPIIMLTARDEEENIRIGIKTGADLYLTKPIEPEKLIEAVNKLLNE